MYSTCLFCTATSATTRRSSTFPSDDVSRSTRRRAGSGWCAASASDGTSRRSRSGGRRSRNASALFRATRLRVSTDQIGLARLREGLELVRIGEPQRPEMAAWRYGDQFGRRRRRKYLIAGGVVRRRRLPSWSPARCSASSAPARSARLTNLVNGRHQRLSREEDGDSFPVPEGRNLRTRLADVDRVKIGAARRRAGAPRVRVVPAKPTRWRFGTERARPSRSTGEEPCAPPARCSRT